MVLSPSFLWRRRGLAERETAQAMRSEGLTR
jgi:hypothetical protein